MSAEIGDLQRRLGNIFRLGKVSEVNLSTGRVKVQFQGATTAWIPWMANRAGAVKDWNPPSVGEQVCVCSPMGDVESGFIMPGSIYTGTNAAPASNSDSYVLEVPAGGTFEIRVGGSSMIFANGKITLNGDIEVTGDVKAGAISLINHTHGGIQPGPGQTSPPT